jgi:formate hydrogenlyase transcriptional activator
MVAKTGASVLLLGETGTGKELLAKAIHKASPRRDRGFIALNCAAIPSELIESELFGHERGSFTGALTQRVGRFEQADGGTLFLDEIGDLPYGLQVKLLRVLQDQVIQRVGGTKNIQVDVRIIAATHQDLAALMANGQFREDLYYRLNVFPLHIPPLRERPEDVPELVSHFVDRYCRELGKNTLKIDKDDLDRLTGWSWPGNVRELANFVERSVICSQGQKLTIGEFDSYTHDDRKLDPMNMNTPVWEALERNTILNAIRAAKGRIAGPNGAAARLGLKRTTLHSKMHRLGIERKNLE